MNRSFRRLKRGAALATTVAIGLTPALVSAPAALAAPTVNRIAGQNRFGTAAAVAAKAFPNGANTVIVATGFNFPDALAGNYLAGLDKAPILLVNVDNVPSETSAALQSLKAKNVVILGQTQAVSTNTENQLKAQGYNVSRIGGATRYDTMQLIDEVSGSSLTPASSGTAVSPTTGAGGAPIGTINGKKTALLARGDNFPDALGGGPVAYAKNFPVILTSTAQLSPQAKAVIQDDGIQQVIILGGDIAVPAAVEQQANAAGAATLYRANGKDRSDTSRLLAEYAISNLGFTTASYAIASGDQYFTGADALASGPFSGSIPQPTLVTNSVNDPGTLVQFGQAHNSTATTCYAIGGPVPLPDSTVNAVCGATPTAGGAQTSLPQLISAKILSNTTQNNANGTTTFAGTVVQYVFSQNVQNAQINPSGFHVYDAQGDRFNGNGCFGPNQTSASPTAPGNTQANNCTAVVDSANPNAVDVTYNQTTNAPNSATNNNSPAPTGSGSATQSNLQTAAGAANLTLATVGGPQDNGGPAVVTTAGQSPDGSAPISFSNPSTTPANQAGVTTAPNLESVTAGQAANATTFPNSTTVNFVYDKAAYVAFTPAGPVSPTNPSGFSVVLANGTVVQCTAPAQNSNTTASPNPSGGTGTGGNGTTTITVVCPNPSGSTTLGTIARGVNAPGTVVASSTPTAATTTPPPAGGASSANPLQASDTPHTATTTPDLTSVVLQPSTGAAGSVDTVVYTFDQNVTVATAGTTGFGYYNANGGQVTCGVAGQACTAAVNSANPAQVAVSFTGSTNNLGSAVGGNVAAGSATGTASGLTNQADELGAAPLTATSAGVTPGQVNAPQLVSVKRTGTVDSFGNPTGFNFTYTFSQPVTTGSATAPSGGTALPAAALAGLHIYLANGQEFTCTAGTYGGTATTTSNSVTCTSYSTVAPGTPGAPTGTAPTTTQLSNAVLGTADYAAVAGTNPAPGTTTAPSNSSNPNPEGGVSVS